MNERQQRIEEICRAAAAVPTSARASFLDLQCGNDAGLRHEVEAVLNAEAAQRGKLQAGEMVGPYRITSILGEGGMGVVYKAKDTRLNRSVALKFIKAGFSERLQREAMAIAALNHPHVATLHDIGSHHGASYLVLEFIEGRPVKGPLSLPVCLEYAVQIASALEAAHAHGIIHRDLKPSNILVDSEGNIKVLDFGLAKLMEVAHPGEEDTTLTVTAITEDGKIAGTAPYMSPEQAEGKKLDPRSDIFSFGAVLYEMISGHRAFRGTSTASVIAALLEREPEPLTGIPGSLRQVLCRALRKDPARRWHHIGDVKIALEDLKTALEQQVQEGPKRRALWQIPVLAAVALLSVIAAGYFAWRSLRLPAAESSYSFQQITDQPGQELNPKLSPDGKSVIYSSRASGNWDIFLHRVGGGNPVNLTSNSDADDTQPVFSPDGERIAFRSERGGGGIFVMGATGESVRRLTDYCYLPAWSPDGKQIACSTVSPYRPDVRESVSSQIFAVDVDSGARKLVTGGILDAVEPAWSPDGRRIAFWGVREGARDIFTAAAEGGGVQNITSDDALDWNPVWSPDGKYLYFSSNRGGAMNLWRVAVAPSGQPAGDPEPVSVPSSYATTVSFSRDGRLLAYSNCQRSSNIHRVAFDPQQASIAGTPQAITQGIKENLYPSISRDGALIAFTVMGVQEDLAVVRTDGGGLRRVTEDAARDRSPRWSPDASQIAFMSTRSGRFEIWTIHPDGSGLQQLTQDSPRGGVWYPAWSPDGRLISYNLPDEMGYIVEFGKPWREQQPQLALAELPPNSWLWLNDWSHDGKKIAGTLLKLDGSSLGAGAYDLAAKKFEKVSDFGQAPRWLPDGRRFLFHARGRIFLADPAAKSAREVLSVKDAAINTYFDLSWDGRLIAFSLEAVDSDVWIRTPAR